MWIGSDTITSGEVQKVIIWQNTEGKVGAGQWLGLRSTKNADKDHRVQAWIKFIKQVPSPSYNFGVKVCGRFYNDFLAYCVADKWCRISQMVHCKAGGDGNAIILIFDSIPHQQMVKIYDMKILS